jgi:hypothetical protein
MAETIRIACEGAGLLTVDEMVEFQGDLKTLSKKNYNRLKKEILETGIGFPFRIWRHDSKAFIIGGHQTKRTLVQMREEGYDIPRVPVSFVEARDYTEAKRRVLQDVAQYGQIDRQGLYEFIHDSEIDFEMVEANYELPNLDMESFKFEFFKEPMANLPGQDEDEPQKPTKAQLVDELVARSEDENPLEHDKNTYLNNNIKQVVLFFEGEEFEKVIQQANRLLTVFKLEDFSALFVRLMRNEEMKYADLGTDPEDDPAQGAEQEESA